MIKKILLLLSIVFVVICYAYPCLVLPFGSYKGEIGSGDSKVEISYQFGFNGKVKTKQGELEEEFYYKVKGNEVIITADEKIEDSDLKLNIDSLYNLESDLGLINVKNNIGFYIAIGVGVVDLILILWPTKKRKV